MTEHVAYALPPKDDALEQLIGLEIEPAEDDMPFGLGTVVEATVQRATDDTIIVAKGEYEIHVTQADARALDGTLPTVGDRIAVLFEGKNDADQWTGSIDKAKRLEQYQSLATLAQSSSPITATLLVPLRRGFSADVDGHRAFLPYKKSGIHRGDAFEHIGKQLTAHIEKLDPKTLELQLERTQIAAQENAENFRNATQHLNIMDVVEGTVTSITKFGAFVDINGIEGLLHISEMSTDHVSARNLPVAVGDTVRVQVVSIDEERSRLGLSRKELELEAQRAAIEALPPNSLVEGKVEGLTPFGAFIEFGDNLRGLCHISELSWTERVQNPSDILQQGEVHTFRVIDKDPATGKISLSLRQAKDNPWSRFVEAHPEGSRLEGRIKEIVDRGLVIELQDELEGFVHLRDLSWTIRAESPSDVRDFQVGDILPLAVVRVDSQKQRILLGVKQLEDDPWDAAGEKTTVGHIYSATVTSLTDNAAFFELVPGLDARMHISEMSSDRIDSVRSVLRVDQEVEVMTIAADRQRRRIDVSIKAIEEKHLREQPHQYADDETMGTMADALRSGGLLQDPVPEAAPLPKSTAPIITQNARIHDAPTMEVAAVGDTVMDGSPTLEVPAIQAQDLVAQGDDLPTLEVPAIEPAAPERLEEASDD